MHGAVFGYERSSRVILVLPNIVSWSSLSQAVDLARDHSSQARAEPTREILYFWDSLRGRLMVKFGSQVDSWSVWSSAKLPPSRNGMDIERSKCSRELWLWKMIFRRCHCSELVVILCHECLNRYPVDFYCRLLSRLAVSIHWYIFPFLV